MFIIFLHWILQWKYFYVCYSGLNFILTSRKESCDILPIHIDRIYVIRWSNWGNGRQYNSMSGYGVLIGCFSGLFLDIEIFNSACKVCNNENPSTSHDSEKNYDWTAKGMEGFAAKTLYCIAQFWKNSL